MNTPRLSLLLALCFLCAGCFQEDNDRGDGATQPAQRIELSLEFSRITSGSPSPFRVSVRLLRDGVLLPGQNLSVDVPNGMTSATSDLGSGVYQFTVTPTTDGLYPVTVRFGSAEISRTAVVLSSYGTGVGQPVAVPGGFVNTEGYEDGITITPDGNYLFVQYGPFYFSGLSSVSTICASGLFSIGYDLNNCMGRPNSGLVFSTRGPYGNAQRPDFPLGGINSNGSLKHITSLVVNGLANGIVGFPTAFYGFKLQADGTFAEPFKVAFNDERGLNGPFGLTFRSRPDGQTDFALAWNNFLNNLGDEGADIYTGTLRLGESKSLGDVVYSGETFASITPSVSPATFSSHAGVQGNPYLQLNESGDVVAIWTDDEAVSHDLAVYRLTTGTFPTGTWVRESLPSVINTAGQESQPTMIGQRLYLNRDLRIVYHDYLPLNGSCASGFAHADCWGPETLLIGASASAVPGRVFGVGEPTVAVVNGKRLLYFAFVRPRSNPLAPSITDFDIDAAFVEIP